MIRIDIKTLLAGRTIYWLSQETGVRWPTLKLLASGKAKRLDLSALDAICKALDCQPGDLLIRIERRKPNKHK